MKNVLKISIFHFWIIKSFKRCFGDTLSPPPLPLWCRMGKNEQIQLKMSEIWLIDWGRRLLSINWVRAPSKDSSILSLVVHKSPWTTNYNKSYALFKFFRFSDKFVVVERLRFFSVILHWTVLVTTWIRLNYYLKMNEQHFCVKGFLCIWRTYIILWFGLSTLMC